MSMFSVLTKEEFDTASTAGDVAAPQGFAVMPIPDDAPDMPSHPNYGGESA